MHIFLVNYVLAFIFRCCLYILAQVSTIESSAVMKFDMAIPNKNILLRKS